MIKVPYYSNLATLRKILEEGLPNFPELRCQDATRVVSKTLGLEERAGYYKPLGLWHAWNYDPKLDLYVDLTLDQFSDDYEPITILHKSGYLLLEDKERTNSQLKMPIDIYDIKCIKKYKSLKAAKS